MVRHLRGSLRHADGPVAAESQRPAHVVVTARFTRESIETDRRPAPPRGTRSTSSPAKPRGATDAQGEVRYQDAIGGRRGASMAGIGRHGLVVIRSSHEDISDPTSHLLMPTAEQGPFPPFDRFAETVATRRILVGLHPPLAEEVVTYVIDGLVHHEDGSGNHTILNQGS